MMSGCNREKLLLARIISVNGWKEFVLSVPASAESGSRLRIFLRNAALIMTRILILHIIFMLPFRINFIMQLPEKPRL